jgi:hypothetical protein
MESPTKKELIEKYQTREPKLFVQVDAFKTLGNEGNLMPPDEDGFWFQARPSYELMDGADITVLINPKTDRKDAVLMLEKMAGKMDREWSRLLEEARSELTTTHGIEGIVESLIRIRGFQLNDFETLVRVAKEKFVEKAGRRDEEWPFD